MHAFSLEIKVVIILEYWTINFVILKDTFFFFLIIFDITISLNVVNCCFSKIN